MGKNAVKNRFGRVRIQSMGFVKAIFAFLNFYYAFFLFLAAFVPTLRSFRMCYAQFPFFAGFPAEKTMDSLKGGQKRYNSKKCGIRPVKAK